MSTTVYEDANAKPSARLAAVCACLLMLVALVDSQVVGAITPQIALGLNSTKTSVAASVMVYALAAAAVALLLGRRAGRVNPVRWLPAAAGIFVAANALAAIAPHVALFWTARALAGLAGGLVSALVIAALADASSYARRGKQMSGVAVAYFLAPVVGVPLGTWLAGRVGWRAVFAASALLVGVAGLLVRRFPLSTANAAKGEAAAGEFREASGELADDAPRPERAEQSERVERTATTGGRTSLWRLAMRSRSTRRGIVSAFFVSGGLVGLTTYLGTWLSDAFRAGTREVGLIYALAGAGAVAGGALGGLLADRYGKRRVAIWSSALMIFLLLVLPTFNWSARLWAVIGATAFLAALRVAPLQALVTELVAASERATYIALRNGASQLGIALAVAAGARLYPHYGLAGVGAMCAALTLGATLSMRKLADPHDVPHDAPRDDSARASTGGDDKRARLVSEGDASRAQIDAGDQSARRRRFSGRSITRKLAAVVILLLLVVTIGFPWLLSFAITKAGTRPDERRRTDTPATHGANFEPVSFTSTDGNTLSGWYLPARDGAGRRVTFILTHGLFRSRYEMLERGLALWRAGYGVLLYDLRRHGASAAEFSTIGFDERHDVAAAYQFIRGRAPDERIVLMGVSMGAAATLLAAAEMQDEKLLCIVAESSFLSFADTARHHVRLARLPTFPFATLLIKFTAWRLNFAAEDYDLVRAARKISRPILFIGGTKDARMPNATVLEPLYAAAASPHKRRYIVEGATHGRAYDQSPDEYVKAVAGFVEAVEAAERAGDSRP
ncbi:MAG TPA: MFS transporter [Pyrinomonadaceae bacterium]|jgi:predicted MFS family arabinose efflux permease/pimeloyl-ACP methyl ester carboxylesterase